MYEEVAYGRLCDHGFRLSRRFGANKLLADFCGQPMLCRAFAATATPGIAARIVVTRSEDVQALCRTQGVRCCCTACPAAMIPFGWGFRRCWSSCRN